MLVDDLMEILAVVENCDGICETYKPQLPLKGVLIGFVVGKWTDKPGNEPFQCHKIFATGFASYQKIKEYFNDD